MATVKPFKGYRPAKDFEKIACPPYDVISSAEARAMAAGNPVSFLHVDKPEIDLPEDTYLYDDKVYEKGKENLESFIDREILKQDAKPCFYLYAQTMNGRTQYGLTAAVSTEEYDKGIIKKHELTRKDKEDDRTRHVNTLGATTGPVFLTYPDDKELDLKVAQIIAEHPVTSFETEDGIRHTFWVIDNAEDIAQIESVFAKMPALYIADGHHRSAAASNVAAQRRSQLADFTGQESWNYFLAVIFPASQLLVMDYNRLVKDLKGLSVTEFLEELKKSFTVEKSGNAKPPKRHTFGMYLDKHWYTLTAKPGTFDERDPVDSLDVSILQKNVLQPLLGIGDPRTDKRIDFVGGIRGLDELKKRVDSGKYEVAFSMYPTSIEELMKVADAGRIMPPKSTWFEPKLRSGMVLYKYDE